MSKKAEGVLNYEKIGKRIRFLRRLNDITQEEVVKATDYSTTQISNIENAKTKLSLEAVVKIAKVLETTPNQILACELTDIPNARQQLLLETLDDCSEDEFMDCLELVQLFLKSIHRQNKS